jgi:hypothetical protein
VLHQPELVTWAVEDESPLTLLTPARLRRVGMEMRMLIDAQPVPGQAARPDPKLIKLITRAHLFREKLVHSGGAQLLVWRSVRSCAAPISPAWCG